eukprot:TRINITY_DN68003_c0_g1_i1.p1 TRINITY_DN68003_c0_g1~~TRINITY_DN68003_c0_g1_i1.p1  ORF type:complete len:172 (+),score=10.99 TRINITY_DN68003_c0_g1_i1:129-644(+)
MLNLFSEDFLPQTSHGAASCGTSSETGIPASLHGSDENGDDSSGAVRVDSVRGFACTARKHKHAKLGYAVAEFASHSQREAVMGYVEQHSLNDGVPCLEVCGRLVRMRRHVDRGHTTHKERGLQSIFLTWPHASEKEDPLPVDDIVDSLDTVVSKMSAPVPDALPPCKLCS